jgi:choline kinase
MKVVILDDHIIRMSKTISRKEFCGTYIGITVFARAIQDRFFHKMEEVIAGGRVNEFFNLVVQELANEGVPVGYTSTDGLPWAEIDDPVDLTFAQHNVFPQLATAVV